MFLSYFSNCFSMGWVWWFGHKELKQLQINLVELNSTHFYHGSGPWKFFFFQLASAMATANALIRVSVRSVRTLPQASTAKPAYLASMVIPPTGENVSVSQIHPWGHDCNPGGTQCLYLTWTSRRKEATWFWILHFLSHTCQELSCAWRKWEKLPSVRVAS